MNMVKVFIKGQEDKELSSFLRYYPLSTDKPVDSVSMTESNMTGYWR